MFSSVFQLEIVWFRDQTWCRMSIPARLNDSIAAIRTLFDLEALVAMSANLLRDTLCEFVEPDLAKP
jgi:hypothetical protein